MKKPENEKKEKNIHQQNKCEAHVVSPRSREKSTQIGELNVQPQDFGPSNHLWGSLIINPFCNKMAILLCRIPTYQRVIY